MQIKCEYCGSMIEETADKCPFCGATNNAVKRTTDKTPKTIAELQQWYQDRHLPPYETTRFFIGINYKKPKGFELADVPCAGHGLGRAREHLVVAALQAHLQRGRRVRQCLNGERAIRYQGTDEAYAVNELYLKLKSEILNQKANNQTRKQQQTLTREQKKEKRKNILITFAIFFAGFVGLISIAIIDMLAKGFGASLFWSVFLAIGLTIASLILAGKFGDRVPLLQKFHDNVIGEKSSGRAFLLTYVVIYVISFCLLFAPLHAYYNVSYYRYNDTIYANTRHSWYEYEDYGYGGDYEKVSKSSIPDDVLANKTDYQFNYNDDSEWTSSFTEFEDSSYYDEHYTSDSDSDSSYDWDSGDSWDSGTTDWDSDW
mgnify:CR=1 FL=1